MTQPDEPSRPMISTYGSEDVAAPHGVIPRDVRGKLTRDAPLDKLVWFKSGGPADLLFEPEDIDDWKGSIAP